jgi:thiamine transport system substrate-binding protein
VTNTELPEGFDSLSVPQKSLTFTADEVAKERKAWVREWQNALTF